MTNEKPIVVMPAWCDRSAHRKEDFALVRKIERKALVIMYKMLRAAEAQTDATSTNLYLEAAKRAFDLANSAGSDLGSIRHAEFKEGSIKIQHPTKE